MNNRTNYNNQIFNGETDNVNDLRNAAIFVTACIATLVVVLYAIKYFCCRSASYSSGDEEDLDLNMASFAAVLAQSEQTNHRIPFSSRIRRMYLEAALKHEIFHELDVEKGKFPKKPDTSNIAKQSSVRTIHSIDEVVIVSPDAAVPDPSDRKDAFVNACPTDELGSFSDDDQEISTTNCDICYEALHEGDEITTSNCNKTFHRQCIMEWLMQHDLCPYCRNPFKNICEESKTVDYFANMDCESSFERRNPFRREIADVPAETQ